VFSPAASPLRLHACRYVLVGEAQVDCRLVETSKMLKDTGTWSCHARLSLLSHGRAADNPLSVHVLNTTKMVCPVAKGV